MYANYHTHTFRCHHAVGTEREYIETAIAHGIRILGFSDHSPYVFDGSEYSGFRVTHEDTPGYFETLLRLRDEYKDDIRILIGFEAEYYPKLFRKTLAFLRDYPLDYLIMGQHFTRNEYDEGAWWCPNPTDNPEILKDFVDQTCEGLQTGCFSYMAHPDVLNFTGDDTVYEREMRRLCACAKECGIPLEINFLGLRERRHYPSRRFLRIMGEMQNTVIYGCDAHSPDAVWQPETEREADELRQEYGLALVPELSVRNPFVCL